MKSMKETVFAYINKKYQVTPEYPWKRDNESAVFRHSDNRKWFAIAMNIGKDKLGMPGSGYVDVIIYQSITVKKGGERA